MSNESTHTREATGSCLSVKLAEVESRIQSALSGYLKLIEAGIMPVKKLKGIISSVSESLRLKTSNTALPIHTEVMPVKIEINASFSKARGESSIKLTDGGNPIMIDVIPTDISFGADIRDAVKSFCLQLSDRTKRLSVRCSAVCSVGVIGGGYEVFVVTDGIFVLYDGNEFSVLKTKW